MDFSSESVVSHLVFWVSSWVACFAFGWVLVFGCVVGFCFGRHLAFCSHTSSPTCGKKTRFDDRQSLTWCWRTKVSSVATWRTQYIQPYGLADVVARYLEGHPHSPK